MPLSLDPIPSVLKRSSSKRIDASLTLDTALDIARTEEVMSKRLKEFQAMFLLVLMH